MLCLLHSNLRIVVLCLRPTTRSSVCALAASAGATPLDRPFVCSQHRLGQPCDRDRLITVDRRTHAPRAPHRLGRHRLRAILVCLVGSVCSAVGLRRSACGPVRWAGLHRRASSGRSRQSTPLGGPTLRRVTGYMTGYIASCHSAAPTSAAPTSVHAGSPLSGPSDSPPPAGHQ